MTTQSKVVVAGYVIAVSGAGIQWGLGGCLLVGGLLMFAVPALDGLAWRRQT